MKRGIFVMKKVIHSPTKYIQGPNELLYLGDYAKDLDSKSVYAIVDPYILDHYQEQIQTSFHKHQIPLITDAFSGECSKTEINRIVEQVKRQSLNLIVGIGGGKTLDTAKAVSFFAKLPVIIVPTIASTDAPCSALSALYTDDGHFDRYLFLNQNPNIVIVDSLIIANAPSRLLVSGMGDALATYFEARACHQSNAKTISGGACSLTALQLAKICYDTLLQDGLAAKLSAEHQVNSKALENIIEANTYLSGIGFESGGLAAAHAIHNGLTKIPECRHMYHGEKVAFGTLVQLVLENAEEQEIRQVLSFCKSLGLPTTLAQLGLNHPTKDQLMIIATASCDPLNTMSNMPFHITPMDVYGALLIADSLGKL